MTMFAVNNVQYFINFLKNTVSFKNGESVILVIKCRERTVKKGIFKN